VGAIRKLKALAVLAVAVEGAYAYAGVQHAAMPSGGHPAAAAVSGPVTRNANEALANSMAASGYGWTGTQATCLDELWTEESGFSITADNSQSGAYGIPQALPADKMASAGADWRTSAATQVKWGLGYIKGTYGSPCRAWAHEKSTNPNWY
jgi:hypothetical protein